MIEKKTRTRIKNRDKSRDYVDGPTLQKNLLDWYNSRSNTDEIPPVITKAILQVIDRLGTSGKFNRYSYLDEMKGDARVACILALQRKKYNPYKYDNPFAYFTQIAWNAFINVINNEHKESYVKQASLVNHYHDMMITGEEIDTSLSSENLDTALIEKFENKKKNKIKNKKKQIGSLDAFMESNNE